jgi:hypothetical protein
MSVRLDHVKQFSAGDLRSPKYGYGVEFEMELVTFHLFPKLSNIDQRLRNREDHAGSITALFGIYR